MNLLHLDSSILGAGSASRAVSAAIVERLRSLHPGIEVTHRGLYAQPIPHLDLAAFSKLADADEVREYLDADIIVIGAGLYNFTVPGQLKAWIDRICVRDKTFSYGEAGPIGLAPDKRVIIALARGGVYQTGTPMAGFEHAETLLRSVFQFLGIRPEFIIAEGLSLGDGRRREAVERAIAEARSLGAAR